MGRKGWIYCRILIACALSLAGCNTEPDESDEAVSVCIRLDAGEMNTKALDPDEYLISDISLMVFDEDGSAEECIYLPDGGSNVNVSLIKGNRYSFRVCANFRYHIYADHIRELDEVTFHMAYPDEYREGVPMVGRQDNIMITDETAVRITLERLMSKISIRIDRRGLSEDVRMNVKSVKIGNCPKSAKAFIPSKITTHDQCFPMGFLRGEHEVGPLNGRSMDGLSDEITLYMLENMQGEYPGSIPSDSDKVFDEDDKRRDICSYIEMNMEYISDSLYSGGKGLIYRFYLGDSRSNLDVQRNCHYRITVRPEDDGLSDDGWRVDKSGLLDAGPVSFTAHPSSYIRGNIGDTVHVWCEFTPSQAPFDVGEEHMIDDRNEGIYDYVIDSDGHGATLTLTGPGRGLIYMEAGEPINEAALFIIEVNLPENATDNVQYEIPHTLRVPQEYRNTQDYRPNHRLQDQDLSPSLQPLSHQHYARQPLSNDPWPEEHRTNGGVSPHHRNAVLLSVRQR